MAKEFVDVETAKQTGRAAFGEMVAYLKAYPSVRVMLVEKTDRLYRNLKDWVTLDELDVEIHFAKEGVVLSRDSRSSEKFMHGIKVLMAKNYIDNLSEETRKGMTEKAEQGFWPSNAPLGYRNVTAPDGKKTIVPDDKHRADHPQHVRMVCARRYFDPRGDEEGAGGRSRLSQERRRVFLAARSQRSCATVSTRAVSIGTARPTMGYTKPIVSIELWERVQDTLDGRVGRKARTRRRDFAFSGLIECDACGCAIVGEIKKERYVYYHCTGYADKCRGNPAACRRKHMREEALERQFTELLGRLHFDDDVLEWVRDALHASHAEERREHEQAIKRLEAECKRLDDRIHAMYADKLDGLIDAAFFQKMSNQWREEQDRCRRDIERHRNADRSYLNEGVALLELANNAQRLFAKQEPREKRRLLNFLLSNCTWKDGELTATFRQPFDMLAETIIAVQSESGIGSRIRRQK